MWPEFGNFWTERTNSAPILASIHAMMHEINILLVDHDQEAVNIANDLEISQYKVTCVGLAHVAVSMLAKVKFDVVMVNISSPDHHGFGLLMHHAINMFIPVVCMADSDDPHVAMWAIENGAFVCIKRPPPMDFLRYLWQQVMREKAKLIKERDLLVPSNNRGVEFRDVSHQRNDNPNPNPNPNPNLNSNHIANMMLNNKGKHKMRSTRGRYNDYDEEYDSDTNTMGHNGNVRRKMCTEWTQELHAKFVDAVRQLGEGRCFPKEILELMNEPGLTRMQVASHLQKCRNDNWRSPEERKPNLQPSMHSSPNGNRTQPKPRRFGSMPLVGKPFSSQTQGKAPDMGQTSETRWEVQTPNDRAKMANGLMMTENAPHHYGASSSMNPRHPSDEYFNFPDMDSLMRDFSGRQQESEINNPNPAQDGYQADPAHNDEKVVLNGENLNLNSYNLHNID